MSVARSVGAYVGPTGWHCPAPRPAGSGCRAETQGREFTHGHIWAIFVAVKSDGEPLEVLDRVPRESARDAVRGGVDAKPAGRTGGGVDVRIDILLPLTHGEFAEFVGVDARGPGGPAGESHYDVQHDHNCDHAADDDRCPSQQQTAYRAGSFHPTWISCPTTLSGWEQIPAGRMRLVHFSWARSARSGACTSPALHPRDAPVQPPSRKASHTSTRRSAAVRRRCKRADRSVAARIPRLISTPRPPRRALRRA